MTAFRVGRVFRNQLVKSFHFKKEENSEQRI